MFERDGGAARARDATSRMAVVRENMLLLYKFELKTKERLLKNGDLFNFRGVLFMDSP